MKHELTSDQARTIARLRGRHPRAQFVVHRRSWGVIVEAREQARVVEMLRCDYRGGCTLDRPLAA